MRIFLAANGCLENGSLISYWRRHLVEPLLEMGHEVVQSEIDWDIPLLHPDPVWRERRPEISQRLLEEVKAAHACKPVDLFFSYFYSIHVDPEAIRQIRHAGIPTANFFCDAAHAFDMVSEISPAYDVCWVTERQAMSYYTDVGATPAYIPMGANPKLCYPILTENRDIPVLFAGRLYADRPMYLNKLVDQGVPVQIYTPDLIPRTPVPSSNGSAPPSRNYLNETLEHWKKFGSASVFRRFTRMVQTRRVMPKLRAISKAAVYGDEMTRVIARSKAVLNFCNTYANNDQGGEIKQYVKLRDFEIPMSRALYMPQYCEELTEFFEPGKEVISWQTSRQLAEHVNYYLGHHQEAEKVREAGFRRAMAEHTWAARYRKLFGEMHLDNNLN